MNKLNLVLLLLLIAVVCVAIVTIFYASTIVSYKEIYTDLVVTDGTGAFAIDEYNMRFGKIGAGGISKRKFDLNTDQKVYVNIKVKGNISQFLISSDNNFVLEPGETKTIEMTAHPPEDTPLGNYSGKVQVYFFRPFLR